MPALPNSAAETAPDAPQALSATGSPGRKGTRCGCTPIGPTPGPPPPWGIAKVLSVVFNWAWYNLEPDDMVAKADALTKAWGEDETVTRMVDQLRKMADDKRGQE